MPLSSVAVQDPLNLAGADLKLELAGTNMELLLPLIGIAFPKTPSYQIKGDLDYADGKIRFRNFTGQLGSSDVQGNIEVDPGQKRPVVTADVTSRQVDLADLGGFLGSEPGRLNTPNQTPEQRQAVARAEASPRLLPTARISLPKLLAADVHLKYRGAKIQGRNMPFDSFAADMDIVDGRILLHPVSIGVGQGRIAGMVEIEPLNGEQFRTKADVAVQRVDLGRMLKATNLVGDPACSADVRCWRPLVIRWQRCWPMATGRCSSPWPAAVTSARCWWICRGCSSVTPCCRPSASRIAIRSNVS